MLNLTKSNFEKETNGKNVLVYFAASWCPPCRIMGPIISEISDTFEKVTFTFVDVDMDRDMADMLKVENVPTIRLYKNGKLLEEYQGFYDKNNINEILTKHFGKG